MVGWAFAIGGLLLTAVAGIYLFAQLTAQISKAVGA